MTTGGLTWAQLRSRRAANGGGWNSTNFTPTSTSKSKRLPTTGHSKHSNHSKHGKHSKHSKHGNKSDKRTTSTHGASSKGNSSKHPHKRG